ncbi:S9 family peptidase OS=Streptomyces alboniger OX=132473 GN=CP975_18750 PE=4 SV=1 [Streptomyces alboniger]
MTESKGSASPERNEDMPDMPDWEKRFRAPRVSLPDWAEDAPDRSLFVSNATGTYELYAWNRSTGEQRQVTDRPNGTTDGVLSPDGRWVWWFDDKDGDEFGVWRRQPFEGGPDDLATPGLEPSYPAGLALARDGRTAVVGRSTDEDGTTIHVLPPRRGARADLPPPRVRGRRRPLARRLADRRRAHRARRRDALGAARRARPTHRSPTSTTPRAAPRNSAWRSSAPPVDGDTRLLIGHQRRGRWEPLVLDAATGEETSTSPWTCPVTWAPSGTRTAPAC